MVENNYRRKYTHHQDMNYRSGLDKRAICKTKNLFMVVCILCGTAIVLAVTVKVIMSLFM